MKKILKLMIMNGKMFEIKGKMVLIGDLHLGKKKFSLDFLKNQLSLFTEQVFPYMEKHNITQIFQFGDLFDNRTKCDIEWFYNVKKEFFDILKEKKIDLYTLKGNHDLALRESRDISLLDTISEIYDNVKVFSENEIIKFNDQKILVVPWITKNESLKLEDIMDVDYIFGHLEIRNFEMTKGMKDNNAKITQEFFNNNLEIKGVYSGHYHLKREQGVIKYLGTPYQLDMSDHNEIKGFYEFDGFSLDFIENTTSKKYIKVKYNDEENTDRNIEVKGLFEHPKLLTDEEFETLLPLLKKHEVKTFINKHRDSKYEEMLYKMKQNDISGTVINNQQLTEIIGTEYIQYDNDDIEQKDTKSLILDTLKKVKPDLMPLLQELLNEVQSEQV